MSKTLQLRCPNCKRLLIKWEENFSNCVYKVVDIDENGKTNCTKCGLALKFDEYRFVPDTGQVGVKA